ncbi:hypothetical protein [Micromonospora zamorensis]|uniref:hypothetical protein n=1 Tax=Micromonospora zamorensis TaxID=709883 RepID=UPI0012FE2F87|nr:hypothetical protein [Micromonospora zamorensis]
MSDPAARFAQLGDEYESRKRTATALVESWDWYTWRGLDLRPLRLKLSPIGAADPPPGLEQATH